MFAMFKWFYLIGGVWFVISGILNLISGFCLRAKRGRTFSLVVAGINLRAHPARDRSGCVYHIVLVRDSVRGLYDARPGA